MDWLKRLFARRRSERSLDGELDEWRIFSLSNDIEKKRAVLRLRLVRPRMAGASFTTAIKITWKYAGDMPSGNTNAAQVAFESAIDVLTGDNKVAELVQVASGGGVKEWLFYCSDRERFTEEFDRLLTGRESYPVEISSLDDPDWQIWRRSVEAVRHARTSYPTH